MELILGFSHNSIPQHNSRLYECCFRQIFGEAAEEFRILGLRENSKNCYVSMAPYEYVVLLSKLLIATSPKKTGL